MTAMDTGTEDLLADVDDGVATITLNRPDRRNALSGQMLEALVRVLAEAEASEMVGAVVLTGAGAAFCSGGDVKGFDERGGEGGPGSEVDPARVAAQRARQRATVGTIHDFAKPVVVSLPGAAAGAGLGIALAADLRIGCSRTLMATAFGTVGLSGDFGTAWLLHGLVGPARARELMMLGGRVDADRCLALGLVNELVADDQLHDHTRAVALRLANGPRLALQHMKRNLLDAEHLDLPTAMDAEVPRHMACGVSADHREALSAFVGKRAPAFDAPWRPSGGR